VQNDERWHTEATEDDEARVFEEWLRKADFGLVRPKRGAIVEGTIVQISPAEILVDIGAKRDGFVPASDLEHVPEEVRDRLNVGDRIPVIVHRVYEETGDIELSISQALQEQDWVKAKELEASGEIVECEVVGYNKGGLIVQFGQVRGFVPLSHVANVPRNLSPEERMRYMSELIGQYLSLKVVEVDRSRRRLILSHREAVRQLREKRKDELLATLKEGDVVHGKVRSIADFGAFIDLGGVDGLVHKSEISWEPVGRIQDVLKSGQEVDAVVIKVDTKARRIGLSLKRLQPNPWEEKVKKYQEGDVVKAVIINITDFGAFARLEEGVDGLIHISELPLSSGQRPGDVVSPGDEVFVKILKIDKERQRISLSMKHVPQWEEEFLPEDESSPQGAEGDVGKLADASPTTAEPPHTDLVDNSAERASDDSGERATEGDEEQREETRYVLPHLVEDQRTKGGA